MDWVEVPVTEWFKACTPNTKPPPETMVFNPWRVPDMGPEPSMYPAVNEGCNDYLEASGCISYVTCCTDPLQDTEDDYLDYNADGPDFVIFPKHPEAVAAYQWQDHETAPSRSPSPETLNDTSSLDDPESHTTHRAALSPSFATCIAKGSGVSDASPREVNAPGNLPPPKTTRGHMSWVWAEVLIEVKKRRSRFPFLHDEDTEFAPDDGKHVLARDRIAEYALEVFRQQHRQAVFMLLILDDYARFVRFDRAGAVVSAAFNYRGQPRTMGEFFHRLFNMDAIEDQRGRDPTAHLVAGQDTEDFRQLYKRFLNEPDIASALEFAGTRGWPVYDLEVTGTWSPDGDTPLTSSSSAVTTHICRVGRPSFASTSVVGRGTRCFAAYDMTLDKPIFIKDTWRVDSPNVRTEADNYKAIWGRVSVMAVEEAKRTKTRDGDGEQLPMAAQPAPDPFVPTLLCHGDVFSPAVTPTAARAEALASDSGRGASTATSRGRAPIAQRTLTQELSTKSRYASRIQHRLAFKEICHTIEDFRNPFELAVGVYSALRAHQFAWEQCGIRHRDISVGNILLCRDPADPDAVRIGLLADWDLAKTREQLENPSATQISRSGTWQFMSALVQSYVNKVHAVSDDLESFLHVLNWCALKYLPHNLSDKGGLPSYFFNIYDKAPRPRPLRAAVGPTFEEEGPVEKFSAVLEGVRVVKGFPEGHPFDILLGDLTALCKSHYDTIDFGTLLPKKAEVAVAPDNGDKLWHLPSRLAPYRGRVAVDPSAAPTIPHTSIANTTAVRAPRESPLKDHTAFILAFSKAVEEYQELWRQPQNVTLVKLNDQIPSLTPLGSVTVKGSGSKHERELALPTGSEGNTREDGPRQFTFEDPYTPDNPPVPVHPTVSASKKRKTAA